jgi:hypothetical protein
VPLAVLAALKKKRLTRKLCAACELGEDEVRCGTRCFPAA